MDVCLFSIESADFCVGVYSNSKKGTGSHVYNVMTRGCLMHNALERIGNSTQLLMIGTYEKPRAMIFSHTWRNEIRVQRNG